MDDEGQVVVAAFTSYGMVDKIIIQLWNDMAVKGGLGMVLAGSAPEPYLKTSLPVIEFQFNPC